MGSLGNVKTIYKKNSFTLGMKIYTHLLMPKIENI